MAECKDCIHDKVCPIWDYYNDCFEERNADTCKNYLPTADVVEVKHGEWIRNERNIPKMKEFHKKGIATAMKATSIFYTCSCCNDWGTPIQKYCSGCGAKMNNVVNYESTKTIKIERNSE